MPKTYNTRHVSKCLVYINVISPPTKRMGHHCSHFVDGVRGEGCAVAQSDKVTCHHPLPESCRAGLEPRQSASCSDHCTLASL